MSYMSLLIWVKWVMGLIFINVDLLILSFFKANLDQVKIQSIYLYFIFKLYFINVLIFVIKLFNFTISLTEIKL